jgi:hypothetical protein
MASAICSVFSAGGSREDDSGAGFHFTHCQNTAAGKTVPGDPAAPYLIDTLGARQTLVDRDAAGSRKPFSMIAGLPFLVPVSKSWFPVSKRFKLI